MASTARTPDDPREVPAAAPAPPAIGLAARAREGFSAAARALDPLAALGPLVLPRRRVGANDLTPALRHVAAEAPVRAPAPPVEPLCPPHDQQYRYERKYRIDGMPLAEVEWWLRRHPAMFRSLYQPRWINNIYFDTPDFRAVRENLSGCRDRVKTRARWYGCMLGRIEAGVLERKLRCGLVGSKQIFVLPPFALHDSCDPQRLADALRGADLPPFVRLDMALQSPVLLNRYHRRYYQSADGRFRATIDTGLEFGPLRGRGRGLPRLLALPDAIVLEVKYAPLDDRDAPMIGGDLPVRTTRNSKYVTGMQMCYPVDALAS